MPSKPYQRQEVNTLLGRLAEPPRFLIFIAGPRQVGKTTLVRNALVQQQKTYHFIPVDQPDAPRLPGFMSAEEVAYKQDASPPDAAWLVSQWQRARAVARDSEEGHILVLDEIQKIPRWSEAVKGLWDADRAEGLKLHIVLLGSSPLLMQKGMTESLAGRFELIRVTHWSFLEMHEAFDYDLDDYLYFGGYPGSAPYIRDEPRWRNYVRGSLIEPSIEKDILMMTRVDKPALLKHLFHLGCNYSGQILSYTKMQGQLQDAGNTVTLAHYLDLLGNAGLIYGIQKFAGQKYRQRASSPKLNVLNNALMTAGSGYTKAEAKADRSYWGRLVESTVGAHLYNTGHPDCQLYYWREGSREVDFVIQGGRKLTVIEVKSGPGSGYAEGLDVFAESFGKCRKLLVGEGGIPIAEFLSHPAEHWL
ncbi:ATP-binding protein [Ferrovum sp.]|uniref:ATP-binding protein n=1 Tax=Ferrovum sp. TaxID=2609467 RepID=UPI002637D011|nr:ATP-binding protein [Ferrovum sp.]